MLLAIKWCKATLVRLSRPFLKKWGQINLYKYRGKQPSDMTQSLSTFLFILLKHELSLQALSVNPSAESKKRVFLSAN